MSATLMTRRRLVKRVGGAVAVAVAKGVAVAALAERVAAAAGVGREGGARRDERGGGGLEGVLEDRWWQDASGVLVERAHLLHRAAVEADERARAGGGALDLLERQRDGGVVQVEGDCRAVSKRSDAGLAGRRLVGCGAAHSLTACATPLSAVPDPLAK